MTDNAGLLLACCVLILSLSEKLSWQRMALASLLSAVTLFTRQIHGWVMAPIVAAAFCHWQLQSCSPRHIGRLVVPVALLLLPSAIVLFVLYSSWKGFVPPFFRDTAGGSLASQCYLLTVFGGFAIAYLWRDLPSSVAGLKRKTIIATALGIVAISALLTLATPTSYDPASGRWGGYLWPLIAQFHTLNDRSVLFFFSVPVGLAAIAMNHRLLVKSGARQAATVILFALSAWIISFAVSKQVFHRYFEPLSIIILAISLSYQYTKRSLPTASVGLLMLLTLGQIILTFSLALPKLLTTQSGLKL